METASEKLASPSLEPGRERDKKQPGKSQRLGLELKIRINRSKTRKAGKDRKPTNGVAGSFSKGERSGVKLRGDSPTQSTVNSQQ